MSIATLTNRRNIFFLLFNILILAFFYSTFKTLWELSRHSHLYSHIFLIPIVSAYLLYTSRKEIFTSVKPSYRAGAAVGSSAALLYITISTLFPSLSHDSYLSLTLLSAIIFWLGGFLLFFGSKTFKAALFPLTFLFLMIPLPSVIADSSILFLQYASADASDILFKLTGVPVFRDGLFFHLPNIVVEVAKECSGIRSSIALIITTILAGHMLLRTWSRRLILVLSIIPLTIFKNGVRIVTLSLLATYVDESFLTNSLLHKKGGIVFFIMALSILAPFLWALRRSEKRPDQSERKTESTEENE